MNHTLQIHVTNECNLRCEYCYIKFKKTSLTLDVFLKQFNRINELSYMLDDNFDGKYQITYFGGEPLLNYETILQIDDYIKNNKNVEFSHIQTNGLLYTDSMKKELDNRNIHVGYSFDGISESNDRKCQYEDSINNCLLNHDPKIMIDNNNINTIVDNYKYFLNFGKKNNVHVNPDFTFVRDNIWDDKSIEILKTNITKLVDLLVKLTISTNKLHYVGFIKTFILDIIISSKFGKRNFCCFAGHNGFALTPDGIIYPCSRFYSNDKYKLYDSNVDVFYHKNINFLKSVINPKNYDECKSCNIYKHCNGGCHFSQLENGDFKRMKPIDSYCKILKFVYSEVVRYYDLVKNEQSFKKFINDETGRF